MEILLADAKKLQDEVSATQDPTFESVIKTLGDASNVRDGLVNQLTFYQHISTDKDVRDSSNKAEEFYRVC